MSIQTTLPAGQYFVGDPMFVLAKLGEDLWDQISKETGFLEFPYISETIQLFVGDTVEADGDYVSGDYSFSVQSGSFGIIPRSTVDFLGVDISDLESVGVILDFSEEFVINFDNGTFAVSDRVFIDTNE